MPELRKRRSHLALLGVFAMVASVLAVGAPSAMAVPGKADAAATYSACVGPATADRGFTDVAPGSTHDAAINCIAYYGITRGTTATTFAPNQTISRWQLAVMLQRAAGPAGVDLPADEAMGFTDISELNSSWQTAINQMARLGVMAGTTATTFDPDGIVSRAVIVEALAGFLTNARVGPGGKALSRGVDLSLTVKQDASNGAMTVPVDETFRDLGGVNYSAYQSIRALAEMGVVSGRGDGTFGPAASVTRAQAAAFITRALAHTNTRPAGLTMQTSAPAFASDQEFELSVSIRGNDFAPVEDAAVDVFSYLSRNSGTAFKNDGTCETGTNGVNGTTDPCTISISDEVTEPDGNLLATQGGITQDTVFVAWTAATGNKLDWDDDSLSRDNAVVSNAAVLPVGTVTVPEKAKVTTSVSTDSEGGNTVRYGTTVTVTIQLLDSTDANIGVAGKTYAWYATGEHAPPSSVLAGTGTRTVVTDSTGKATFSLTQGDPDTNKEQDLTGQDPDANDQTTWTYVITAVGDPDTNPAVNPWADPAITNGFSANGAMGTGTVIFDDDDSAAAKVSIELSRRWTPQPASGGTNSVGVTGKVIDQYGRNLPRQDIFFDLSGDGSFAGGTTDIVNREVGDTTRRTTRSSGSNTISASLTGVHTNDETVDPPTDESVSASPTYQVAADLNGDGDVGDNGEVVGVIHYWAQPPAGFNQATGSSTAQGLADGATFGQIYVADLARNILVMRSGPNTARTARMYSYTDDATFKWSVANDPTNRVRWLNTEEFETRMAKVIALGPNDPPAARLQVNQYNTKTGISVFEVLLNSTVDIFDPASG